MYDTPRSIEQILTMLAAEPSRLASLTKGLAPAQLLAAPAPGEWAARDVLAHLRACSDMWGKFISAILSEERPTIKAVNPTTWIKQTNYREHDATVATPIDLIRGKLRNECTGLSPFL